jgi:hypothetical protein
MSESRARYGWEVIELKGKEAPSQADIDQAAAYARDLRCYHRECSNRNVVPVLVPHEPAAIFGKYQACTSLDPMLWAI